MSKPFRILLTNDDGVHSPGLWAAARALAPLGEVIVAAPCQQSSGAGRSMPSHSEGRIHRETVQWGGQAWPAFCVEGTPAQVVQHALLEIMPRLPDLIVSGINYGENVGSGVTISGTVGAALEGASFGVRGLAVSLQTDSQYHLSHSDEVDFGAAAHFAHYFAERMLGRAFPPDVDVLKVEVPEGATAQTAWRVTRLSRHRYYIPLKPQREHLHETGRVGYQRTVEGEGIEADSDVGALLAGVVSVTPLSLDLTSRVALEDVSALLKTGL